LRIDDRLRVAKERREEADKQQALRGSQIMERERKAKLQVERQIEERQKKVEEQRRKEEQKRQAVEEKRKQKQEEEKEHFEAVMRRTQERSQRVEQRQKRWSWGGLTDSEGRTDCNKRSTSTTNLKQPPEASISKRLSSSTTLIKSPDKSRVARRPPSSTVDGGVLSRLLTPTQASLARSKSAATLSADGKDAPECHLCPRSASATPLHPPRGPVRSRSIDRQKGGMTTSVSADGALDPSLMSLQPQKEKQLGSPRGQSPSTPSSLGRNRSPSPAPNPSPKRTPSPAASKQSSKARPPSPSTMKQRPASPQSTSTKPPPIQKPALTPTGPPTLRKRDSKSKDLCPVQAVSPQLSESSKSKDKDEPQGGLKKCRFLKSLLMIEFYTAKVNICQDRLLFWKPGRLRRTNEPSSRNKYEYRKTSETDAVNVMLHHSVLTRQRLLEPIQLRKHAKILAENRRLMREQREREEQLRIQREEEEKLRKEEEKRLEEEARLIRRQERDRIMQQNQQERMERKKRIEEIMKRTRKGDQGDLK
uniref:MAP7 domain containing 3 n=1 Tax=Tetraodon nigroviridis TaxID=99883 RepID=H3DHG8_TETNG